MKQIQWFMLLMILLVGCMTSTPFKSKTGSIHMQIKWPERFKLQAIPDTAEILTVEVSTNGRILVSPPPIIRPDNEIDIHGIEVGTNREIKVIAYDGANQVVADGKQTNITVQENQTVPVRVSLTPKSAPDSIVPPPTPPSSPPPPESPEPETITTITPDGSGISGSVSKSKYRRYSFQAVSGIAYLVTLTANSGDPDLYVGTSSSVSSSNNVAKGEMNGSESLTITAASSSTYYIAAYGWTDSTYTLKVEPQQAAPPPPNASPGTVTGGVRDDSTLQAISGATVSINGSGYSKTTTTNSTGNYTFNAIPQGIYTVTGSMSGFQNRTFTVNVTAGQNTNQNIALYPNTPPPPSTGTVTGGVRNNDTNQALGNATVSVSGSGYSKTTTTTFTGNYIFSGVPAGTYTVTGSMSGFQNRSFTITVSSGQTTNQNIALYPNAPTYNPTISVTSSQNPSVPALVRGSGHSFTQNGSGFPPNSTVTYKFQYPNGTLASLSRTTDSNGFISNTWTPDVHAVTGTYSFWIQFTVNGQTQNTISRSYRVDLATPTIGSIYQTSISGQRVIIVQVSVSGYPFQVYRGSGATADTVSDVNYDNSPNDIDRDQDGQYGAWGVAANTRYCFRFQALNESTGQRSDLTSKICINTVP